MADYNKNIEKIDALYDLFPNSKNILISVDSEIDGRISFDLGSEHVGEITTEDIADRGQLVSIAYKDRTIHFVDMNKFLKSIQE